MEEWERLRRCTIKEAKQVFSLIRQRMRWMDKKGFDSWNQNHYDEIFPLSYFEKEAMLGRLFALVSEKDEHIISAAVLLESDSRWNSEKPAIYVHNFVSDIESAQAGQRFLEAVECYAKARGKQYVRLDSAQNNSSLENYYTNLGFAAVGICQEGVYQGVLRQKEIHCQNSENGLE